MRTFRRMLADWAATGADAIDFGEVSPEFFALVVANGGAVRVEIWEDNGLVRAQEHVYRTGKPSVAASLKERSPSVNELKKLSADGAENEDTGRRELTIWAD